jgi:hypothetical protein
MLIPSQLGQAQREIGTQAIAAYVQMFALFQSVGKPAAPILTTEDDESVHPKSAATYARTLNAD